MRFDKIVRPVACILSFLALAGIIVPVGLFFTNALDKELMKNWLFGATILWFVVTPFWMERENH